MREHKYRAWHRQKKAMLYFTLGELNDSMITKVDEGWYLEDVEVMEWTGLLDSDGQTIYEGDIVIRDNNSAPHIIAWDEDDARYWTMHVNGGGVDGVDHERMEVIGNIYETPELLAKTD